MYFEQAYQGNNKWWAYVVTLIGVGLGYFLGGVPLLWQVQTAQQASGLSQLEFQNQLSQRGLAVLPLNENMLLALIVLPFFVVTAVLYFCITKVHKKNFQKMLTVREKFDWSRVGIGFGIWFILACILTFALLDRNDYIYQFAISRFIPLLFVGIFFVPVGAIAEEIFFRSYLMKAVFLIAKSPFVSLLVISVMFGLLHGSNPEMQFGLFKFLSIYIFFGLILGVMAILDGGIELPIGIHVANNVFVALILSTNDGMFSTPSIFQTSVSTLLEILPVLLPSLSIIVFISLFFKYKWSIKILFSQRKEMSKNNS